MIATPTMVFVHLHKTGGQFINRLLLAHIPGAQRIGYHLPRSEAPMEIQHLPALGFVRNPWDWYVSWYAFNITASDRNPIFRIVSDHGALGFARTIENLITLGLPENSGMRMLIAEQLPVTRENSFGSGITRDIMAHIHEPDRGYMTWIWRYMFHFNGSIRGITTGRFESLRHDLVDCLMRTNIRISTSMHDDIQNLPAVNVSSHGDYRDYYSNKLADLIAKKDNEYIEYHGYRF
jgi:hypothetical protein